ncbi:preprotein translocase subunit SecG [Sandaracinobacteroides hominis]|uniref:preprotein translocase subunit SecG n=1 Tax=Sandaracinobacteroides hominis TaxID=2780086 RepID=UPI0018F6C51D|nr:preprotein translocase subunit SecG [Sandaracinobacteroides hominis]
MTFLLVVHGLLALALVGVILLQKSEGGGLTGGGSAGGLVSARGAADLLSRTTAVLATLFIISSLGLAWLAGHSNRPQTIDTSLARESAPVGPLGSMPAAPPSNAPPIAPVLPGAAAPGVPAAPATAPAADQTVPVAR